MGGEESEVTEATTDLLLECAAFDPRATRRTSAATDLSTDASYRFERGIDEAGLEAALIRCVELIVALAGGEAEPVALRAGRAAPAPATVRLRPGRVRKLLGLRLSPEQIVELLRPLGFEALREEQPAGDPALLVNVPTWRSDVTREVDVIEEIARRYGYERFPQEARSIRPSTVPASPTWSRRRAVRRLLEGHGLYETRGLPMVPEERVRSDRVELRNPLSATESVLRTDLVPPLLDRVAHNLDRGRRDVRLFEIGTVFAADPAGHGPAGRENYLEELRVGIVLSGGRAPEHWTGSVPDLDVWDIRGLAEDICERLTGGDLRPHSAEELPAGEAGLPGFGADGWLDGDGFAMFEEGRLIGVAGRVRSAALDTPPWAAAVFAAEFRLDAVRVSRITRYEARPAYPAVTRDLALVVPDGLAAGRLEQTLRAGSPDELVALRPFDVYEGGALDGAGRSIAWRLVFRAPDRTLTDGEVDGYVGRIVSHLTEELDVRVRDS